MDRLEIEAIVQIATFLPAKDVVSLLSTNRAFRAVGGTGSGEGGGGGGGAVFWNVLHQLHYGPVDLRTTTTTAETAKAAYLLKAHCDKLEMVRWHRIARASHGIEAREGHLGCRLQDGTCIITGGFVDNDNAVYVKRMGDRQWTPTIPQSRLPTWVYGATLTPLPDGRRAVRFGGFRSGGYGNETAEVCLVFESLACVVVCDGSAAANFNRGGSVLTTFRVFSYISRSRCCITIVRTARCVGNLLRARTSPTQSRPRGCRWTSSAN
jgi:hypothetical protein